MKDEKLQRVIHRLDPEFYWKELYRSFKLVDPADYPALAIAENERAKHCDQLAERVSDVIERLDDKGRTSKSGSNS